MAEITPKFIIGAVFIGGVLGIISLFTLGFISGFFDLNIHLDNIQAYACCFSVIGVVVLILAILQVKAAEQDQIAPLIGPSNQKLNYCPNCFTPLQFNPQYKKWYCNNCGKYI